MPSIYVFFHNWAGGETYMPHFFMRNRDKLAENGLIYSHTEHDAMLGAMSQQNILSWLLHTHNKKQEYPAPLENALKSWRAELDSGNSILLSFRSNDMARNFLAFYSLFNSIDGFGKHPQKYFISLGRPDFYVESACRAYPQFGEEDILAYSQSGLSYAPFLGRVSRVLANGNFRALLPQISPFADNKAALENLAREFLDFSEIRNTEHFNFSLSLPSWPHIYLRKILNAMNNSWQKPSQAEIDEEIAGLGIAPEAITIAGCDALRKIEGKGRLKWEAVAKSRDASISWQPLQLTAGLSPFRLRAGKISDYIAANWRLASQEWHNATLALLPAEMQIPESPKMAVLTMAYNHEKYIGDCIESVIAQERDFSMEHIIVDDCSQDATRKIISDYALKYPHIRPVFIENRATGANVTSLFRACSSNYAALCDGDDYFTDKRKLQKQHDFLEKNPDCSICAHFVKVHYENGGHKDFVYPPPELMPRAPGKRYILENLFDGNFIQTNSAMYRWRFKDGLPAWFRADVCPGDWYWHLLHAETGKIGFIPSIMSVYRRHDKAMYSHSFLSEVEHRRAWGMRELATYDAIDKHFNGQYFNKLASLANGVIANFLQIQLKSDDDMLINTAVDKYPKFAANFLKKLKKAK